MERIKFLFVFSLIFVFTASIFGATITVYVKDSAGGPITTGQVGFAGIPKNSSTGDPDPNEIYLIPILSGMAVLLNASTGYSYIVVADIPGYAPTFTEQIHSPNYPPVTITNFSDNKTINRIVYPLPASSYGTLKFTVSISTEAINMSTQTINGKIMVADIRNSQTDAPVAMGISSVFADNSGANATIYTYNTPAASASTYRAYIGLMASQQYGVEIDTRVQLNAGQEITIPVDFSQARLITKTDQAGENPAFTGVVFDQSGKPIQGARVELLQHNPSVPEPWDFRDAKFLAQTYTDIGGNFAFYNIPTSNNGIAVQINKSGYLGIWDANNRPGTRGPGNFGEGYKYDSPNLTINLLPYFLEEGPGSIQGRVVVWDSASSREVGIPNAHINVYGNWDTWLTQNDASSPYESYYTTGTDRGGKGWAEAVSDANGNFVVTGLGPGNFNLSVWSEILGDEYNYTNPTSNNSDKKRIRITSDTHKTDVFDYNGNKIINDVQ